MSETEAQRGRKNKAFAIIKTELEKKEKRTKRVISGQVSEKQNILVVLFFLLK